MTLRSSGGSLSWLRRTHGSFGLDEMVWLKYVDSDRLPSLKKVWWYGYGQQFARHMEGFLNFQFAPSVRERVRGVVNAAGVVFRKTL